MITKPGKHGTLKLYRIAYHDDGNKYNDGISRVWAYDEDHAIEKFYDSDDTGWVIASIGLAPGNERRAA